MWEAVSVNGYGTHDEAIADSDDLEFGGVTDWELPTIENLEAMYEQADIFSCGDASDCITAYAADMD